MPATAAVALANMVLPVPGGPLYCVNQEIQISHWLDSNNNAANNDQQVPHLPLLTKQQHSFPWLANSIEQFGNQHGHYNGFLQQSFCLGMSSDLIVLNDGGCIGVVGCMYHVSFNLFDQSRIPHLARRQELLVAQQPSTSEAKLKKDACQSDSKAQQIMARRIATAIA